MMSFLRAFSGISCGFLLLTTGCASLAYRPSVQAVGEYRDTSSLSARADEMDNAEAADVRVLLERFPDGVELGPDGPRSSANFTLLGKVSAAPRDPRAADVGLWFYPYKEGERWRTALCAWQVPLSWVTLDLWQLLPTYLPCRVGTGTADERRAEMVRAMQRATKALGGDLLVVARFEDVLGGGRHYPMPDVFGTGYAFKTN
jgi:hypothetical protein